MKYGVLLAMLCPTYVCSGGLSMQNVISVINPKLSGYSIQSYVNDIYQYATVYGVNPQLVASIIAVESKFNERAVGSIGELGLMQLRPEFHMLQVKKFTQRQALLIKATHNIAAGVSYLAALKRVYEGHYPDNKWIELYNTGPSKKPKRFTYYKKVMKYYHEFEGRI